MGTASASSGQETQLSPSSLGLFYPTQALFTSAFRLCAGSYDYRLNQSRHAPSPQGPRHPEKCMSPWDLESPTLIFLSRKAVFPTQ